MIYFHRRNILLFKCWWDKNMKKKEAPSVKSSKLSQVMLLACIQEVHSLSRHFSSFSSVTPGKYWSMLKTVQDHFLPNLLKFKVHWMKCYNSNYTTMPKFLCGKKLKMEKVAFRHSWHWLDSQGLARQNKGVRLLHSWPSPCDESLQSIEWCLKCNSDQWLT